MSYDVTGEAGLQFFGKMIASISHEIKNVLAVINENAGLLEDFILMEEKGVPLNPEKLKRISKTAKEQVKRADGIIQNMNRFAHSVDEKVKTIDVIDTMELMIKLSARFSERVGMSFKMGSRFDPVKITTTPFLLQNVIWFCLDNIMNLAKSGDTVSIAVENAGCDVLIRFFGISGLDGMTNYDLPAEVEAILLKALSGKLQIDKSAGEIVLYLNGNKN
jgi:signal transduction histidine kinase